MLVSIEFVENKPVSLKLPEHIKEQVVETEAVIKGQTAASSFKPAILSNGFKIMVPGHIENDTFIILSSTTFTYVEKAKIKMLSSSNIQVLSNAILKASKNLKKRFWRTRETSKLSFKRVKFCR